MKINFVLKGGNILNQNSVHSLDQSFKSEVLHIAFCTDKNYAKYMGVAITSIILNNSGIKFCFHIFCSEIDGEDREKILRFEKVYQNIQMKLYSLREIARIHHYKIGYHFTVATFYRLFVPDMLENTIYKILYLDCDILCIGQIHSLFHTSMNNKIIAAPKYSEKKEYLRHLRLQNDRYFCAGELLIDVMKWKQNNVMEKCLKILDERHAQFSWADQDALNCLFDGDFVDMPQEYACMIDCSMENPVHISPNDKMIHYVGGVKPWKVNCFSDRKNIWWKYVKKSFWDDLRPEEPNTLQAAIWTAKKFAAIGNYQQAVFYYDRIINYFLSQK